MCRPVQRREAGGNFCTCDGDAKPGGPRSVVTPFQPLRPQRWGRGSGARPQRLWGKHGTPPEDSPLWPLQLLGLLDSQTLARLAVVSCLKEEASISEKSLSIRHSSMTY